MIWADKWPIGFRPRGTPLGGGEFKVECHSREGECCSQKRQNDSASSRSPCKISTYGRHICAPCQGVDGHDLLTQSCESLSTRDRDILKQAVQLLASDQPFWNEAKQQIHPTQSTCIQPSSRITLRDARFGHQAHHRGTPARTSRNKFPICGATYGNGSTSARGRGQLAREAVEKGNMWPREGRWEPRLR